MIARLLGWLLDVGSFACHMPGCHYRSRSAHGLIDHLWDHAGEVEL